MKYLIMVFVFLMSVFVAQAQTNRTVMVNTNGVLQKPTNFWTANSNSINSIISGTASIDWVLQNFAWIDWVVPALSEKEQSNSDIFTIGSSAQLIIPATNSSGVAAIRMARNPNFSEFTGTGIRWGITNSFFVRIITSLGTNGDIVRIILGGPAFSSTNFVAPLTGNGAGIELTNNSGTNQIRLIAHNGTTNIQTSWINAASATTSERINIGVVSSVGTINLYQSSGSKPLTLVTNISITNGPTQNAGGDNVAFSAGIIATNTNSISRSLYIYDALLRASE